MQERGHVLTVHAQHPAERAVRIARGDAGTAQPADIVRVRRGIRHIAETTWFHILALASLGGETMQERGHVLTVHRRHATERAVRIPLRDAGMGEPENVLRMRGAVTSNKSN